MHFFSKAIKINIQKNLNNLNVFLPCSFIFFWWKKYCFYENHCFFNGNLSCFEKQDSIKKQKQNNDLIIWKC
jgi:hypothetical protein